MKSKPFTDPEDLGRMLASLPETALLTYVRTQARVMNAEVLAVIVSDGVLEVELDGVDAPSLSDMAETLGNRLSAFSAFTDGISMDIITEDRRFGALTSEMPIAVFGAPAKPRALIEKAAHQVAADYTLLKATPGVEDELALHSGIARLMAGAIALDLPKAVEALAQACPEAMTTMFPLSRLGNDVERFALADATHMKVNPFFTAVQLSRQACLEAMFAKGLAPSAPMGEMGVHTPKEFGLADHLAVFAPVCRPEALAHALNLVWTAPGYQQSSDAEAFKANALQLLKKLEDDPWLLDYVPAIASVGVFAKSPAAAVQAALASGEPTAAEAVLDGLRVAGVDIQAASAEAEATFPQAAQAMKAFAVRERALALFDAPPTAASTKRLGV
ncbi:hypothetical protein ACSFA0_25215 [Variovorax sp. LT1P1]|uniref:hypothetical protein n=1 Tax=Variovorax sp. LT1P1 TaxID=3443730 RepID=UPI003F450A82